MDTIVLTHGHEDHLGDTVRLAQKYGATVVGQYEVCMYVNGLGVGQPDPMNTGGAIEREGVRYAMVLAFHSSALIEDGKPVTMGIRRFVIQADGSRSITRATPLCSPTWPDPAHLSTHVGLICIGDRFTMGPETAAIACNEFLDLELIVPIHWGTFGLLSGQPEDFQQRVHRGRVHIATPGERRSVAAGAQATVRQVAGETRALPLPLGGDSAVSARASSCVGRLPVVGVNATPMLTSISATVS